MLSVFIEMWRSTNHWVKKFHYFIEFRKKRVDRRRKQSLTLCSILGFLSTTTEVVPGNAGIKDVREALNWIQRNIETFGGDPNMVTLSGQSAGAAVVHLLGLSNSTEGLFNSYITQSGSALAQWAMQPPYFVRLKYLTAAKSLGCTSNIHVDNFGQILSDYIFNDTQMTGYDNAVEEDKEIVRCMRRASPARLVQTITLFVSMQVKSLLIDIFFFWTKLIRSIKQLSFRSIEKISSKIDIGFVWIIFPAFWGSQNYISKFPYE